MNQTEAVKVIHVLSRAGLVRVLEGQGPVWAAAMPDVRLEDAIPVVNTLVREHTGADRWVTPGDIIEGVKALRDERHKEAERNGADLIAPPEDLSVRQEIDWKRAYRSALGDGYSPQEADRVACAAVNVVRAAIEASPRPVAPVIDAVAKSLPRIPRKDTA